MSKLVQLISNAEGELAYALDDNGNLFSWERTSTGFNTSRYDFVACDDNVVICGDAHKYLFDKLGNEIYQIAQNTVIDCVKSWLLSRTSREPKLTVFDVTAAQFKIADGKHTAEVTVVKHDYEPTLVVSIAINGVTKTKSLELV